MQRKILFVEDDHYVALPLKLFFENNGYLVIHTDDGAEACPLYEREAPDIILLDVELPNKNGFEIISEIRREDEEVPVIFITGTELSDESMLKGYELGAFNYLPKPIHPKMIMDMINNILRKPKDVKSYIISGYNMVLNRQCLKVNGKDFILRDKEAQILELLLENVGAPIERKEILIKVWKEDTPNYSNSLDVCISRLKKILSPFGRMKIKSIYATGYILSVK